MKVVVLDEIKPCINKSILNLDERKNNYAIIKSVSFITKRDIIKMVLFILLKKIDGVYYMHSLFIGNYYINFKRKSKSINLSPQKNKINK